MTHKLKFVQLDASRCFLRWLFNRVSGQSNGKSTIWRCISYSRWEFSIAMFVYRRVITWDKWFHVSFQKFPLLALQPAWLSMENPPFWRVVRCGEYYISKNKREIDIAWIPGMHGYPPNYSLFFSNHDIFVGFLRKFPWMSTLPPFPFPPLIAAMP